MTGPKPDAPTSALHRTDVLSLIFGLLFLGVAGWWAASYYLDWVITWHLPDVGWLLAGGLILLGLIGILASLRRDRRVAATPPGTPAGTPAGLVEPVRDAGPAAPGFAGMPAEPATAQSGELDPRPADDPTTELDRPGAGEATTDPGEVGGHRPRDI